MVDIVDNKCKEAEVVDVEHEKWKKLNKFSRVKYLVNHITVEPLLASFIIASVLGGLTTQNLNLQKACRVNLNLGDEICTALNYKNKSDFMLSQEKKVQDLVTTMIMWQSIIQHTIPCLFVVFIGSWSDRTNKRKPILLLPIIGELTRTLGLIVCVYYFYELPMEVAGLVESVPSSLSGGWMIMFMAVFTYISDVTTVKMRTLRIGVINLAVTVGLPIGIILSGILFKKLGFYGVYSICSIIYSSGMIYGIFCIKDAPKNKMDAVTNGPCIEEKTKSSFTDKVLEFFNAKHIKGAFTVTFKEGKYNRRIRVIMIMAVLMILMGPMSGEMSVMYLSTRVRFNWDEVQYSIFSAYFMIIGLIGTSFSLWVFSHKLKIDDALIAAMACFSKIIGCTVFAFAQNEFVFFLGPVVEIFHGAGSIATRSMFTKLVEANELGQVCAVLGIFEAFVPLIYAPMYSSFYRATMQTFPGAFFLLGGGLTIPAFFIFLWMYKENKKQKAAQEEELKEEMEQKKRIEIFEVIDVKPPKFTEISEKKGLDNTNFQSDENTSIN
ncbi:proton-coupled folate transporter-like [Daktulosphaira vitifoliae]|uniref:proton-coupled folate transporter-like n=1 Tax=Daktulosphaira vitifoliae TaxID=58002 RepID=UPI0021AA5CD0|nr:proton-coupled folate transporter-like [Daktulosphaira vitifoliae]XP_050538928.1 proton-coupled folate transporter-like [Daktulosphaira vitifoliae]